MSPWPPYVEVHCGRHKEANVTSLGPELVGIALLTDRPAPFDTNWSASPYWRPASPRKRPSPRCGVRDHCARKHAPGSTGGSCSWAPPPYVDALTREGISLALTGAEALVDNVRRGTPDRYESDWNRAPRRHRLLAELLVRARQQPALAPHIVPAAEHLPRLFAAAVNALA